MNAICLCRFVFSFFFVAMLIAHAFTTVQAAVTIDQAGVDSTSSTRFDIQDDSIHLQWPIKTNQVNGHIKLRTGAGQPLIASIAISDSNGQNLLSEDVDPVTYLTVGSRQGMKSDGWVVFFDHVDRRPYETYQAKLSVRQCRLRSSRSRAVIEIDQLAAGPFHGRLELEVYAGSPLIKISAVMQTSEDRRAILYDAGLVGNTESWDKIGWLPVGRHSETDAESPVVEARRAALRVTDVESHSSEPPLAVKHRTVVASRDGGGSIALFSPPHQFFYPLDNSTNLKFNWVGSGFHGEPRQGFGIRQHPQGDGRLVPWFNAPPGTEQRMSFFLLISRQDVAATLEQVLTYTRGDRFKPLDGYQTMTSHYHVAHTMDVIQRQSRGEATDDVPQFVSAFRDMGVNIVHLAEFHGDGNPRDAGPKRLPQLQRMHHECERLSGEDFLLLPGEEPNVHLGGHWLSFFPRPVYWVMKRQEGEPFVQKHPQYGQVYRVGNAAEMHQLLSREQGLAWTAHPRIKGSHGYPDNYQREPFYISDRFLGAAWKSMPADLSRDKLGERVLDLLDDMANWSVQRTSDSSDTRFNSILPSVKYVLGEVDVFKIDRTHELYGHMNINYVRLDKLPNYIDGWHSILDALRAGRFFVSTGEVLIPEFMVGSKRSGEKLHLVAGQPISLRAKVEGTFPLSYAEVISGDGQQVYRERIDFLDSPEFEQREIKLNPDLTGRRWIRLEVWDVAANGAFTQPIWIES